MSKWQRLRNDLYEPVVGIVNMNMICAEVTAIPHVKIGDTETIIGED